MQPLLIKKNIYEAGFTLVETLVAITILLIAVGGSLTVASQSIASAALARDQTIAFWLAQDAMEYIHNARDTNILQEGMPWLNNLGFCNSAGGGVCQIDTTMPYTEFLAINLCINHAACDPLLYDSEDKLYSYSDTETATETIFTRSASYEYLPPGIESSDEVVVTVTVSWESRLPTKSIVMKKTMLNWASF